MVENKQTLDGIKKEYAVLMKKHTLPSFEELNEDFLVEKATESETDFLIREIRKCIGDKLFNYHRFIESLLNPMNAPMFIFSVVKSLDADEKKKLSEIYKELSRIEMKFIKLDLEFNEEKEAEFIRDTHKFWQTTKKNIMEIIEKIESKWDNKSENNTRGYFG